MTTDRVTLQNTSNEFNYLLVVSPSGHTHRAFVECAGNLSSVPNKMLSILSNLDENIRWIISFILKYLTSQRTIDLDDPEILYESPNFLVINKQCDIAINTNDPSGHPVTVATQLNRRFPHLSDPCVQYGFRFCHRLDYSTSGILCLALNRDAAAHFASSLQALKGEKYYLALVYGHLSQETIIVNKSIGSDSRPQFSHKMCTAERSYCKDPKWAVSRLLVLERGLYGNYPATKLLLKLCTGRRHQLRVHCHELGHTIIGDYTYSDRKDSSPYRMFLHSFRLTLPTDIEKLDVFTEDPFTEDDPRNKWRPIEIINTLNSEAFVKISNKIFP